MTASGSPSPEAEKSSERRARQAIERQLVWTLRREPPAARPRPDYRCDVPVAAVEVKEITSGEWLRTRALVRNNSEFIEAAREGLTGNWMVLPHAPNAEESLTPEWKDFHNLGPRELAKQLRPLLLELERHDISSTYDSRLPQLGVTYWEIKRLLGPGSASRAEPTAAVEAGIVIAGVAMGHSRTEDPDVFAKFVQLWLDSTFSRNLRASLDGEPGEQHAYL